MALTNALFTGLSGLDVNQTRLGVVGNNIANVNTVAFKSSRALFKPQFYVTDGAGTPPSSDFGGTNPNQRGLGASVAAIEKDFSQGSIEPTGKSTDMAIDGDGWFVVEGSEQRFTRDGSFSLNAANELVTTDGSFVQGFGVDEDSNVIRGELQNITVPVGTSTAAKPTDKVTLEGNLNAAGDAATGASILTSQLVTTVGGTAAPTAATPLTQIASNADPATPNFTAGDVYTLKGKKGGRDTAEREFTVTATSTVQDLLTFYQEGLGIDTTVPDDGNAVTPVAGAALETDATVTTAARFVLTGNLGTDNALSLGTTAFNSQSNGNSPLAFADGTNAAGIKSDPTGESIHTTFVAYDSLGSPVTVDVTAVLETKADTGNVWRFYATSGDDTDNSLSLGNGTLTFDGEGKLKNTTGATLTVDRADTGATSPLTLDLDFGTLTSLTDKGSSLVMTQQDGYQIGELTSFSVTADGQVQGAFSNGLVRTLGQLAVATFSNNGGLVDRGGNQYVAGGNSGVPIISAPLEVGAGAIRSGALEQSNVDLSKEFVNMIISSTGFSAASRVISTSDQLITELLNSTR
jgi:flagellar hook protein FlgE